MHQDLAVRVASLEARAAVHDLTHRYSRALDSRDFVALSDMFVAEATFEHPGGAAEGRAEVVAMFHTRLAAYGLTYHYGHSIGFETVGPNRTESVLNAHAELVIGGRLHIVALRYTDTCRSDAEGTWRFQSRRQEFLYVLPHDELALGAGASNPVRWPGHQQQ